MQPIKVSIYNLENNLTHGASFDTIEQANEWIASIESKNRPWNYAKEGQYLEIPYGAINSEMTIVDDEFGGHHYEYIVPKQYVVEIKDLTNDVEYIKANIEQVVLKAIQFGQKLSSEFIAENIMLGITQANKTKEVRNALNEVFNALQTGSLYDAIDEAKAVVYRDNVFITDARLISFINKIETYLGLELTTEI